MIETSLLILGLRKRFGWSPGRLSFQVFERCELGGVARFGRWWLPVVSILLLLLAALYVRPAIRTGALGSFYASLSSDPLAFANNPVAYRVFTPWISYALGLRGDLIILTNLIFATLLLGLVYRYFQSRDARPGEALFAGLTMTYSLVTLTTVYFGGYTDSATYVLVFAMWRWRSSWGLYLGFYLLALWNRESIIFLLPWYFYLIVSESRTKARSALVFVVSISLVTAAYFWSRGLLTRGYEVSLDMGFYLDHLLVDPLMRLKDSLRFAWLGLFSVFKILWFIPVMAAFKAWQAGRRSVVYSMAILLACCFAQLLVAYDNSRMLTMAFPIMIVALMDLYRQEDIDLRRLAPWLLLLNLFVPQIYTAEHQVVIMHSPVAYTLLNMFGIRV